MNRSFVTRLCAAAIAAASASAGAVPIATYYAYDLHDSPDIRVTSAAAMSRSGNITGYTDPTVSGPRTGFVSTPHRHFAQLASLPGLTSQGGTGVNDRGQVAGTVATTVDGVQTTQAFITGPNGAGITPLGALDGNPTAAAGINDAGQVVGRSDSYKDNPLPPGRAHPLTCGPVIHVAHCFITDAGGANMRDIGALVPGATCAASGVNAKGRVTGTSALQPGDDCYLATHAFLTAPGAGSFVNIDTLGGFASFGRAVNASGMVAGSWERVQFGLVSAFVTGPDGQDMRDLGTLGGDQSFASAINVDGNVVGGSSLVVNGVTHAFVTDDGGTGMHDLNDITAGLPTVLHYGVGIDDHGRIVAYGDNGHSYLLCPTRDCGKPR